MSFQVTKMHDVQFRINILNKQNFKNDYWKDCS